MGCTPPTAGITPGGPTTFCAGGSVTLTATGGGTYARSTGATTAAITTSTAGTYTVTVTGANGCTAIASQVVTVNAAPTADITGATTFCPGTSVTLTAMGGGTYAWSTGATTAAISVTTASTYTVTVTSANGCTATASHVLTGNPGLCDNDNDGYTVAGGDCNDNNSAVNPGASEICGNNIDDNCNNQVDENCGCSITAITVSNISPCNSNGTSNPADDTFTANVTVTYNNQPATGSLNLSGDGTATVAVGSLGSPTSHTFMGVTMSADGSVISLTASFTDGPPCSLTNNNAGIAPASCSAPCSIVIQNIDVTHENCPGAANGKIVITATSANGQLIYSIDGGATFNLTGVFNNLAPGNYNIVVKVLGDPTCIVTANATVNAAPAGALQTWYKDLDNDLYSDGVTQQSCTPVTGYKLAASLFGLNNDCNDNDPLQKPGQTWYKDADNDGYSNGQTLTQCLKPLGYKTLAQLFGAAIDCNDGNAAIYPGATEICNGIDDNCDGLIDNGAAGGLTYVGNVTFSTQAQVNAFSACYSVIQGNLTIQNAGITSLANLVNLVQVTGNVTIKSTGLINLTGLNNLTTIGGTLTINNNAQLVSLTGMGGLTSVGGALKVFYNFKLADCCAFYTLINTPGAVGGVISIFLNKVGCNSVAQVNTNCAPLPASAPTGNPQPGLEVKVGVKANGSEGTRQVDVFPNPAEERVNVIILGEFTSGTVRFIDSSGRLVIERKFGEGTIDARFDIGSLPAGLYLLQVHLDGEQFTRKLIIE